MRYAGSIALAALMLAGCAGLSGGGADASSLEGIVYSTGGSPLHGVEVRVGAGPTVRSDRAGRFSLPAPTPGTHRVSASREGYEPCETRVDIAGPTDVLYLRLRSVDDLVASARTAIDRGRLVEALDLLKRAREISPESPAPAYLAAIVHVESGEYARARAVLDGLTSEEAAAAVDLLYERIREKEGS